MQPLGQPLLTGSPCDALVGRRKIKTAIRRLRAVPLLPARRVVGRSYAGALREVRDEGRRAALIPGRPGRTTPTTSNRRTARARGKRRSVASEKEIEHQPLQTQSV